MSARPGVIVPPVDGPAGAAFTTRTGGTSTGPYASLNLGGTVDDDPAAVTANRDAVCAALGIDARRVVAGTQIHGAAVRRVGPADGAGRFGEATSVWPEGDGLWTDAPEVPLAVFGADCLPILLWRRDRPGVAAVHAGWRGLVAGVVEAAVAALGSPGALGAAIGPGIGPCCYPVSDEVRGRFRARFGDAVIQGPAVDLAGAARAALTARGIAAGAIWTLETCTACDADRWFSFRRDGAPTGRQAGLVWALPDPAQPVAGRGI